MKPYTLIIDERDYNVFQRKCQEARNQGYKLSSSSCGFVNSADYDFCSCYQAIFVLDETTQTKDYQPLINTVKDLFADCWTEANYQAAPIESWDKVFNALEAIEEES